MQKPLFIVFYEQEEQNHHTFKSFLAFLQNSPKLCIAKNKTLLYENHRRIQGHLQKRVEIETQ